ncbi:MAG: single-stranded-DNA-specific exonuclease RecJ [Gemmatimonadota bacterium]
MIPTGPREAELPPPPAPEWALQTEPDAGVVERLERALSLPRPLCALLAVRDVVDPDQAKCFLRPRLEALHPPEAMRDLETAAARLLLAVEAGETILVHGDYDVDGVCATALLTLWLRHLGGQVVPFVPHRTRDGYDLGEGGIRAAEAAGATLLVTCDSGIVAHDAVSRARAEGIDVIVTDHHTPGETLPDALAVVNPARTDCPYPEQVLCGTGVVFKLCQRLAVRRGVSSEELWPHLDLVALATVADLVPLTGENRVLVRFGLRYLAHTKKPGLRALMEAAGLTPGAELGAGQIGFVLAPRLNAAGRMEHAEAALRLLLADSADEARELAAGLEAENRRRQEEDRKTLAEAIEKLAVDFDPARDFGVVIEGEGWHPGVIGIVASRVVERIHRPVVLIALDGARGRGSARSIPGVHLFEALRENAAHLSRFGGHRQAAGMDIERDEIAAFRAAFRRSVEAQLGGRTPRPELRGDLALDLSAADEAMHALLEYLGPFGMGNPRPVFWARGLRVVGTPRVVGNGHLKLRLAEGKRELDAIGFGLAPRVPVTMLMGGQVDVLYQLQENEYRGTRSLQARLVDLRPSSPLPLP